MTVDSAEARAGREALTKAVAALGEIAADTFGEPRADALENVCVAYGQSRVDLDRWAAIGFLARGDDPAYNTLPDGLREAHRALIRLVALVDLADGEEGSDSDRVLTHRTAVALDDEYRRLGEALDAFKAAAVRR